MTTLTDAAATMDTKPEQTKFAPVPQNIAAFEQMSRAEFLGKPVITSGANGRYLIPGLLLGHEECEPVPFMTQWRASHCYDKDALKAVYSKSGAAVLDGGKVVASYQFGDHLVVAKSHRRQGIGAELVYQFRTRYPEVPPAKSRTKPSQALQAKVWDRIASEVMKLKWAREALEEVNAKDLRSIPAARP